MPRYEINVRAVVRAAHPDADAAYEVADWEVYDSEDLPDDEGTSVRLRCDKLVTVEGADVDDAVEQAKVEAPPIDLGAGWTCEDVMLWVDVDQAEDVVELSEPAP